MPLPSLVEAISALDFIRKNSPKNSRGFIAETIDVIRKGRPTFLIFGPGGCGKSILKNYIQTFSTENLNTQYEISLLTEEGGVKGRRFARVKAFPGQEKYLKTELDRKLVAAPLMDLRRPIVFFCVSYGYRSVDTGNSISRLAPQGINARAEEVRYLRSTLEKLSNFRPGQYVIFTVILKQDLWWDERKDVDRFYTESDSTDAAIESYTDVIDKFSINRNVTHIISPLCLARVNLKNQHGVTIKGQSEGYDDDIKRAYNALFIKKLSEQVRDQGLRL